MKENLEKFRNILTTKKESDLSDISKNSISNFKNFVNAALLGATISISGCHTLKPENKLVEVPLFLDFGYKEPEKDTEGYFLARSDLKDEKEVSDGFESIAELFKKLNSMTKTQVEPGFKPYYYGEIDEETGEKIPTFILVGEYHSDILNRDTTEEERQKLKKVFGKNALVENNEDYMQTVEALALIHDKFGIKNIGLEGKISDIFESNILGYELNNLGVNTIPLESYDSVNIGNDFFIKNKVELYALMKYFGHEIENLDYTEEEKKVIDIMDGISKLPNPFNEETNLFEDGDVERLLYNRLYPQRHIDYVEEYLNPVKELDDIFSKVNTLEDYEKARKELRKMFEKKLIPFLKNEENMDYIELYLKNERLKNRLVAGFYIPYPVEKEANIRLKTLNDENLLDFLVDNIIEDRKFTVVGRNTIGMEKSIANFDEQKIGVMLWGKAHMKDMQRQLIEKYNGKVNIYVAK